MVIFGNGPIPMFLFRSPPLEPPAPALKDFDAFYTDDPVVGIDFMPNYILDTPCIFDVVRELDPDNQALGFSATGNGISDTSCVFDVVEG